MGELAVFAVVWLVTWLLHSTLLYGGAWLVERLALLRAPAAREHLWRAAMLGALLTATVQATGMVDRVPLGRLLARPLAAAPASTLTALPIAVALPTPAEQQPSLPLTGASSADLAGGVSVTASSGVPSGSSPAAIMQTSPANSAAPAGPASLVAESGWWERLRDAIAANWGEMLFGLWLIGAGFAVLRLVAAGWCARRELADRAPATGLIAAEFTALCAALRLRRPALCVAPALDGPVSLPNGVIAVPPWVVASLDVRQRRALLAHELAHQVRRDPQWQVFALGLHALLWLQPLHVLARRRLAALAELQADAWAARAVGDPRALAECLAECAERLGARRAEREADGCSRRGFRRGRRGDPHLALFGAAMTKESLLVERVDQLLEEAPMRETTTSWLVRGSVLGALAAASFVFPGCDMQSMHVSGGGRSTSVSISDDGDTSIKVWRSGYDLEMQTDGGTTFTPDESDVATLAPRSTFELDETLDGVQHVYTVKSDATGKLTRTLTLEGVDVPFDAAAQQWLAGALPRMFRESGFDAPARVARLLAAGGVSRVLSEVDLCATDYAKAQYLGELLGTATLDNEQTALALTAASRIGSDYELHNALARALQTQSLDAPRYAMLLQTAAQIGSDYELSELLIEAAKRLPADDAARAAWIAAAGKLGSDYEQGRAIEAGLDRAQEDPAFTAQLVALAAKNVGSDYELRSVIEAVAPRASDPAVAAAYLEAVRQIGSDYEQSTALITLLDRAKLDSASLGVALDVTARIGSNYEKCEVLKALAGKVVGSAELSARYRDAASSLASFERGEALTALDEAGRN